MARVSLVLSLSLMTTAMLIASVVAQQSSSTPTPTNTSAPRTTTAAPHTDASMTWQAWLTVATCATVLVSLSVGIVDCAPSMVMSAVFLYLCQIVALEDVLSGLSNSSVATIALLFVVVDPIADLPKVRSGVGKVLGDLSNAVGLRWATFKIVALCMATSSFLNNTPQVAVLTNIVKLYCRDCGAYPSQILLPMNFATLCGNYALIGTSTNLIVDGLMQKYGMGKMPFFELLKINGPFTVVMVLYLVFMPAYLLPTAAGGMFRSIKEDGGIYMSRLRVRAASAIIGIRITALLDAYRETVMLGLEVLQLQREEITIFPVTGEEVLQEGDVIMVRGDMSKMRDVDSLLGLEWVPLTPPPRNRIEGTASLDASGTAQVSYEGHHSGGTPSGSIPPLIDILRREQQAAAIGRREGSAATPTAITVELDGGNVSLTAPPPPAVSATALVAQIAREKLRRTDSVPSFQQTPATLNDLDGEEMRETSKMVKKVPSVQSVLGSRSVSPTTQLTPTAGGQRHRGFSTSSFPAMPEVDLNVDEQVAARSFAYGSSMVNVNTVVPPVEGTHTTFVEVVLGPRSAALGTSVASGHFQLHYNVTILAVRSVDGLDTVSDLYLAALAHHVLSIGDTVLLLARENFREERQHGASGEFIAVNEIESTAEQRVEEHYMRLPSWVPSCVGGHELHIRGSPKPIRVVLVPEWYPYISVVIFLVMLGFAIANYDIAVLALIATILVVGLGLTTTHRAIAAIEWEVIIMVAFSFTLAAAMTKSGFSVVVGQSLRNANVQGIGLLYLIAFLSTVMTNVITNKACVQVLVPIVVATYREQGQDPLPAVMMTCALASMALSTPYGFATNLMVMGPGGYKPVDFIKFGLPLNILATGLLPIITALVYKMEW